jgi:hypothetical protein
VLCSDVVAGITNGPVALEKGVSVAMAIRLTLVAMLHLGKNLLLGLLVNLLMMTPL